MTDEIEPPHTFGWHTDYYDQLLWVTAYDIYGMPCGLRHDGELIDTGRGLRPITPAHDDPRLVWLRDYGRLQLLAPEFQPTFPGPPEPAATLTVDEIVEYLDGRMPQTDVDELSGNLRQFITQRDAAR